jgi:hypothetical protein
VTIFPGSALCLRNNRVKKRFAAFPITSLLQEYINHFTVLICRPPQVVPLTLNLHEYFIDEKCITIP